MFDIKKILGRSLNILWDYKVLWIFGFLLALASFGNNFGNQSYYSISNDRSEPIRYEMRDWHGLQGDTFAEVVEDGKQQFSEAMEDLQREYPVEFEMVIAVVVTAFVVVFVLSVITTVLRYVAEMSTIRMVNEYEDTGIKVGFRQGWKYGWTRETWRLFGVSFVIHLPVLVLFVLLGLVTWRFFVSLLGGVESTIISSLIAGTGLAFLGIFATGIIMVVLYVLRDLAWRMIALDGAPAMASLRMAWAMFKRQWKNVGLMWLVMVGLKIAWGIAMLILVVPMLIVSILTAVGGLAAALIPSLLTAGLTSLFAVPEYWPWVFAAIIGMPFFVVVSFSPMILISGFGLTFQSNVWTLTYRELKALENGETETPVEVIEADVEPDDAEGA